MNAPRRVHGIDELRALVGQPLGPSEAVTIDQARVNAFADATGDHQWIHVDEKRAAAQSPWGSTIVHGYLVLSILPVLLFEKLLVVEGFSAMINYGLDKLRFPAVTPVGAAVSLRAQLDALDEKGNGHLGRFSLAFEVEGSPKPCCAATALIMFSP